MDAILDFLAFVPEFAKMAVAWASSAAEGLMEVRLTPFCFGGIAAGACDRHRGRKKQTAELRGLDAETASDIDCQPAPSRPSGGLQVPHDGGKGQVNSQKCTFDF